MDVVVPIGGDGPPSSTSAGAGSPTARFGDPRFYALLDELAALHSRKNHDYASSNEPLANLRMSEAFGIPAWKGTLVRMSDKWGRIVQLSQKAPLNESLRDSLIDLSVYSLLCILLLEENP